MTMYLPVLVLGLLVSEIRCEPAGRSPNAKANAETPTLSGPKLIEMVDVRKLPLYDRDGAGCEASIYVKPGIRKMVYYHGWMMIAGKTVQVQLKKDSHGWPEKKGQREMIYYETGAARVTLDLVGTMVGEAGVVSSGSITLTLNKKTETLTLADARCGD